jgi:hypothetical protein
VLKERGRKTPKNPILPIDLVRGEARFAGDPGDPAKLLPGAAVLLLDGAVHSGKSMVACASAVLQYKPASLASYSVILKRGSVFIPTMWGVMTDETDRAHFLLKKIPNNRLNAGGKRPQPNVHLRRLAECHVERPAIHCNVESINRATWGDRLFQMNTSDGAVTTYLIEEGENIVGFLTLQVDDPARPEVLTISEIVSAQENLGHGGLMLRFADSVARQLECRSVRLNAIEAKVSFYEHMGYEQLPGATVLRIEKETYIPMQRTVLYHHHREHDHSHSRDGGQEAVTAVS